MKRKLWIILALVALLYCSVALADAPSFIRQPADGHLFPGDETVSVSWELDFVPVRTEVLSGGEVIDTLTAGETSHAFGASGSAYSLRVYTDDTSFILSDPFTVQEYWAYSGTLENGMEWRLAVITDEENSRCLHRGCLRIDGAGNMPDFSGLWASPWDQILRNAYSISTSAADYNENSPIAIQLDDRITGIGAYSFNLSLTARIHFPASLKRIGDYAFHGAHLIDVHSFPEGLQSIGSSAFENCVTLLNDCWFHLTDGVLTLPDSLMSIGTKAFAAVEIEELRLPHSLPVITAEAFTGIQYLLKVWLPNDLAAIGDYAFAYSGNYWDNDPRTFSLAPYGQEMTPGLACFPDTLQTLGESAFYRCANIRSLILPGGLRTIPESCFEGCCNLTSVTLPETLTTIGYRAFNKYYSGRSNSKLPEITIPRSVTEIGELALGYSGDSLKSSYIQGITIRGYRNTEAEDYVARQNDSRFIFVALDAESLTLFGESGGESLGGENADPSTYAFTETETAGTYALEVNFDAESHVGLRRDVDDRDGARTEWYSAVSPGESSAVLTNRGATADPAALLTVPQGPGTLTLTDNGDGSYTLSYEATAPVYIIVGDVTEWQEVEMTEDANGTYTYSTQIDPNMSWSSAFEFYFYLNGEAYTADTVVFDTVSGLSLYPQEDSEGDYYGNIRLASSGYATYTFTFDPADMTLNITNDLETPGAFLMGFRGDYPIRMGDPSSGDVGMGEGGGSEPPVQPYAFPGGTTLWASAWVYGGEWLEEGPTFYIGCNGQTWGVSSVSVDTAMTLQLGGRCPIWVEEDFDGGEFDFYYCPETHQLMIQKHIHSHQLTLYTWNAAEERPMGEVEDDYEGETDAFIISPASAIHYDEEWDEALFVYDDDTLTITAPVYPGYHVVAWYPCRVSTWWSSDSVRYELDLYGEEPSLGSGTPLTYRVEDGYGDIHLTAVYEAGEAEPVSVTFNAQGGAPEPEARTLQSGETISEPQPPVKIGAVFTGWYTDAACEADDLFSLDTPVMADMTLYAGWLIPEPEGFLKLPAALAAIDAEAFQGIAAEAVIFPNAETMIIGNPFAGSAVQYLYGFPASPAESFAEGYGFTFVPIDNGWLASH